MAGTKDIKPGERRYQDYLRQRGVRTANNYTRMLARLRNAEVERVVKLLAERYDPRQWALAAPVYINEIGYLPEWYRGLIVAAGLPQVGPTARALVGSADAVSGYAGYFEERLAAYAAERAGAEISSVSGTLKETVQQVIGEAVARDVNIGVEQLARTVRRVMPEKNAWQARRIAQTEMMNALAEAGDETAQLLGVGYVKTWCISGLGNTRETHAEMDGVTVEADGYFELRDCVMRYPHDTRSKPPASQIVNCACSCIRRPQ